MVRKSVSSSKNMLFWLLCTLVVVIGLSVILFANHILKKQILSEYSVLIKNELETRSNLLIDDVDSARNLIDFFHATPPIKAFTRSIPNNGIDPIDNTPLAVWTQRLETIFEAYLINKHKVSQARVVLFDESGSELVRVEEYKGTIRKINNVHLQYKKNTPYFSAAQRLNPNEVYVSSINLNREWGNIEHPFKPTYRIIKNIFYDDKTPLGFIIINIDANGILNDLKNNLPKPLQIYVVNTNGGAVLHTDRKQEFAFEFNEGQTWAAHTPLSANAPFNGFKHVQVSGPPLVYLQNDVELSPTTSANKLSIIIGFNQNDFYQELNERRSEFALTVGVLVGVFLLILVFYQYWIMRNFTLAQKEAEFEAIIGGSNDPIVSTDLNGDILSWNASAESTFGYSSKFALGKSLFNLLLPNGPTETPTQYLIQACHGEYVPAFDINVADQRGNPLVISVSLSPIYEPQKDTIFGAAAILRDITEQKRVALKIIELNATLEQRVAERTSELEQAKNEALQASNVKSDFIANVSHEIRTPMNGVLGMLHLLEKESLNAKQTHYLNMAKTSAGALTNLIDDILDLSKIEAGKLEIDECEFDITALLDELCQAMAINANKKGLRLISDLGAIEYPLIISDDNRIRQILINLIGNATKFTTTGKIVVSAHTSDMDAPNVNLNISVRDTGVGIAESKLGKLFQPFSQEDTGTTRQYGGTGLGLAISKKLCQLLGGDIQVKSTKNVGTTFTIELRVKCASKQTSNNIAADPDGKTSIMVIAGDPDIRRSLNNTFNKVFKDIKIFATLNTKFYEKVAAQSEQGDRVIIFADRNFALDEEVLTRARAEVVWINDFSNPEQPSSTKALTCPFSQKDVHLLCGLTQLESQTPPAAPTIDDEFAALLLQYSGRKILLVDDNEINIEVGKGILLDYGMNVTAALDGESALDLLRNNHFDLVLMDCQMPTKDGFETTRCIRRGEGGDHNTSIPIIAMTANAMSGARESCLEAGMNDFMAKPIDPTELAEKLIFWLSLPEHSGSSMGETFSADEPLASADNDPTPTAWDQQEALQRVKGRADRMCKLIDMFIEAMPARQAKLLSAAESGDYESLAKAAHEIKGIAGNIGGKPLFQTCASLEVAATNRDSPPIRPLIDTFTQQLAALTHALETYRAQITVQSAL